MGQELAHGDEAITTINVVPLVDIVLVLLIIFMVTAHLIAKPAIDLQLPRADTGEHKERNQFAVLVGQDGSVAIDGRRIDRTQIERELRRRFEAFKREKQAGARRAGHDLSEAQLTLITRRELTMIIAADAQVSHGRVIGLIDAARRTGIAKYAFNVDPTASAKGGP
jgi:biopolymer transport protein ExbD